MHLADALYGLSVIFLAIGWMIGIFYLFFAKPSHRHSIKPLSFHLLKWSFLGSWLISWILMVILIAHERKFHWDVLVGIIFLVLAIGALWILESKTRYLRGFKEEYKRIYCFGAFTVLMLAQISTQFFLRYA